MTASLPSTSSSAMVADADVDKNRPAASPPSAVPKQEQKRLRSDVTPGNDIARCLDKQLDDFHRHRLLTEPWTPDVHYDFPRSGAKKLSFK